MGASEREIVVPEQQTLAADVKAAVELMFEVKVADVNVVNVGGKQKRFGQRLGRRQDYKKAYVRLAPGQSIDLTGTEA